MRFRAVTRPLSSLGFILVIALAGSVVAAWERPAAANTNTPGVRVGETWGMESPAEVAQWAAYRGSVSTASGYNDGTALRLSNPTTSPSTIGVTDLDAHTGLEQGTVYRVTARLQHPHPNISAGLVVKEVAGSTPVPGTVKGFP